MKYKNKEFFNKFKSLCEEYKKIPVPFEFYDEKDILNHIDGFKILSYDEFCCISLSCDE